MTEPQRSILEMIKEGREKLSANPWIMSGNSTGDPHKKFAYTIGMSRFNRWDFCIWGIDAEDAASLLGNVALKELVAPPKHYRPGDVLDDIGLTVSSTWKVIMIEMCEKAKRDIMMMHYLIFGEDVPLNAMQLTWPDNNGVFPWEEDSLALHPFFGDHALLGQPNEWGQTGPQHRREANSDH